jgi:elongation factor P--beta-lysine ligase
VLAEEWRLTAKALRPLPVAHKPMSEEARVRQRYVDLIVRPEARRMVEARDTVVQTIRAEFHRRGFVEVETPMLQVQHGGAAARPFVTHSNALDIDLYLRIAPELYLKRAVVGGIEKVFEVNRNFRNEGVDATHSPEFAMLEAYEAYADYDSMATLSREFIQACAVALSGDTVVTHFDGTEYDLGGQWASIRLYDAVSNAVDEEVTPATSLRRLHEIAEQHGIEVNPAWVPGKVVEELFEALIQHTLVAPTFVRDFPLDTSPLVRAHRTDFGLAEKWDLYAAGVERGHRIFGVGRPRSCSGPDWWNRRGWRPRAIRMPCNWTRTSSGHWSTGCRRPVVSDSVSTAFCSCSPEHAVFVRRSSSPWCDPPEGRTTWHFRWVMNMLFSPPAERGTHGTESPGAARRRPRRRRSLGNGQLRTRRQQLRDRPVRQERDRAA